MSDEKKSDGGKARTVSEHLRGFEPGTDACVGSFLSAVLHGDDGGSHWCADTPCDECIPPLARQLADEVAAEMAEATRAAVRDTGRPMKWVKRRRSYGAALPEPREGEGFGAYLARCFVMRPLFEDGEPALVVDETGKGEVVCIEYVGGFSAVMCTDGGYVATSGVPCACRPAAEALAGDGRPLSEGETVWLTEEGAAHAGQQWHESDMACSLFGIGPNDGLTVKFVDTGGHARLVEGDAWCPASWLTHEEPDSLAKIEADAAKTTCSYFGSEGVPCDRCPGAARSKCSAAMALDLLARQRAVFARGGAE